MTKHHCDFCETVIIFPEDTGVFKLTCPQNIITGRNMKGVWAGVFSGEESEVCIKCYLKLEKAITELLPELKWPGQTLNGEERP